MGVSRFSTVSPPRPRVAITMGDPAGIGPEICLRLLQDPHVLDCCTPVIFGDWDVLAKVAKVCDLSLPDQVVTRVSDLQGTGPIVVDLRILKAAGVRPGQHQASCGHAAFKYLEAAVTNTLLGEFSGVATAPIHKQAMQAAGVGYPGHTEYLAEITQSSSVYMMLASDKLCVSMVTGHVGLQLAPKQLSRIRILEVIRLTQNAVTALSGKVPRLAVSGLNPHSGEGGLFGSGEEERVILPAVEAARKEGIDVEGPLPADILFIPSVRSRFQAFVTMYHDQGHIPFKMLSFDQGIHMTLGLPFVRTSVAHGTAFDIAWTGKASPKSLINAVLWVARLAAGKVISGSSSVLSPIGRQ